MDWSIDPNESQLDRSYDESVDSTNRAIKALSVVSNKLPQEPEYVKLRPYFHLVNYDVGKQITDQST